MVLDGVGGGIVGQQVIMWLDVVGNMDWFVVVIGQVDGLFGQ